jgi:hypothetical protein
MKYEIIDDFLDPDYYNLVANTFLASGGASWDYVANMSTDELTNLQISHQGFSHGILINKQPMHLYPMMLPMLENIRHILGNQYCYRARADMTLQTGERRVFSPHVDMTNYKHNSAILYINDSDGDTILYDKECPVVESLEQPALEDLTEYKRITPKANRLLLFEGNYWHTGESPVDSARRVIINMNFGDEEI